MADNVNIIVQDTINDIVVNAAVIVETIDINVQVAVDEVQIIANPNNYVVNINRIIGEQVQSDWDQADDQAPDYIKNKPTIPAAQVNSDWNATTGVAEILNKPTIPAAQVNSDWNATSGISEILNKPTIPSAGVTSVGLTMPSAFSVANSPITSAGTLAVTGAGVVSQYVRGDGSLANFPTSTGGGASLSFYLNGSVSQGTFGGVAFKEMDRTPILGAGTDFTINANGYIQSFITDANVPNLLEIPAGNWNFETYFSASSGGGSPSFYVELYKWNGATLSLIASNSATPEGITNGTAIDLYVSALAVPQTTLLATDRLAVRIYVTHSGRTITLHTENSHLCEVITTFSTGITALNGLTAQVQSFATGTSGNDFAISSTTATHTFNLPTASAANRGALSSTDWSTFNGKQDALGFTPVTNARTISTTAPLSGGGDLSANRTLSITQASTSTDGYLSSTDWNTFNNKFTLPALTSGSVLFSNGTTIAQDNAQLFWDDTNNRLGIGTNAPSSKLQINTNNLGTTVTDASGVILENNTPSVSSGATTQFSPSLIFRGSAWKPSTTTSDVASWKVFNSTAVQGIGSQILSSLNFQLSKAGGAYANAMTLTNDQYGSTILSFPIGHVISSTNGTINFGTVNLSFSNALSATSNLAISQNIARTSGLATPINISAYINPTSGTGETNIIQFTGTINQTGGANGITRGLYVAPTITAAADFRAIETTVGNVMLNTTSGNTLIGTSTNAGFKLDVNGTARVANKLSVGTPSAASALMEVTSTTQGLLPPRMTTTQKNAIATPAAGLIVYDTTLNKLCLRTAAAWETITSV